MAFVEIKSAFVEPWNRNTEQHPSWGMKIAEPHSRKDEQGNYQTVSRTFFTVKVSRESGINLAQFAKGDRISLKGKQVTEVREHEGKKYYDLVIWADEVTGLESRGQQAPQQSQPAQGGWAQPGQDYQAGVPF